MASFKGEKEQWSDWSFVFKSTTRSACHGAFQILDWVERQDVLVSEDAINSKFMDINAEKASGELFDILITLCKGEALAVVRSETGMQGFVAWQLLHLEYSPRTIARAMMSMTEAIQPPKIGALKDFETSVRAWDEELLLELRRIVVLPRVPDFDVPSA